MGGWLFVLLTAVLIIVAFVFASVRAVVHRRALSECPFVEAPRGPFPARWREADYSSGGERSSDFIFMHPRGQSARTYLAPSR